MKKILLTVLLACFILSGCQNKNEEPGVVARVNGKPIYLTQLEYKYDLSHEGNGEFVPSVAQVREEYGQILGDLIVQELVSQELEQRNIPVSAKELKDAENEVRSDYPDDSFEQILIEEYIDINQSTIVYITRKTIPSIVVCTVAQKLLFINMIGMERS
jgi:hypothetical protein